MAQKKHELRPIAATAEERKKMLGEKKKKNLLGAFCARKEIRRSMWKGHSTNSPEGVFLVLALSRVSRC
jgi:hypothetical protein